ncbi:MAG: IS30 family transposase, partial [Proteobacteria bacterium]|nr:IS30 family transposase [Pseudomonadota bacterium]
MKNYKRLVESERERIFLFYHAGKSIRFIADSLFRSPSTISRELKRNRTRAGLYGYSVFVAQHFSQKRASSRKTGKLILSNSPVLLKLVLDRLQKRWSPQQISRYLKRQYP